VLFFRSGILDESDAQSVQVTTATRCELANFGLNLRFRRNLRAFERHFFMHMVDLSIGGTEDHTRVGFRYLEHEWLLVQNRKSVIIAVIAPSVTSASTVKLVASEMLSQTEESVTGTGFPFEL
jgi:hypothetical protein